MNGKKITKGARIKDGLDRWATVLEVRDNTLIVDKFYRYIHIDNVVKVA